MLTKIFYSLAFPNWHRVRDLCAAASVCPAWRDAAAEPCLWRQLSVQGWPLSARLTGSHLQNLVARSRNTLTRLWLDSCPLVIDTMLARAVQLQQPCLVYVWVNGCSLVTRRGLAYAVCDSDDIQGIVAQLTDPRVTVAAARRCCVALRVLLDADVPAETAAALAEAQAIDALFALLYCADEHALHAGVQAACCWALGQYVCVAQHIADEFPFIFQAAVAALNAHPFDFEVQQAALFALRNACCFGLEGTPGVLALLDAIQPVLAALRALPTDLNVQTYGCDSLTRMCKMDASVAEAVAAAGAMDLFIKALRLDFTDNSTPVSAVEAIGAIARAPAALPQASAAIDAVLCALRRNEANCDLAEAACKTLGIYLRCLATRERARSLNAHYVVIALAQIHRESPKVTVASAEALTAPQA